MAFKAMLLGFLSFLLLLIFVYMDTYSIDCGDNGHGCFYGRGDSSHDQAPYNRKMLIEALKKMKKEEIVKRNYKSERGGNNVGKRSEVEGWELRRVPSGPDPLHHNGATPKKPRASP